MRTPRVSMAMAVVVAMALAGCGGDDTTDEDTSGNGGDTTQIANPASQFCVDQGGTVDLVEEADGTVGYCELPDGTRVEEWEYFHAEAGDESP